MKGFKDFILRGNIIELAVAVVIGGAFNALITQFTKSFIDPLIAAVGGGNKLGLAFQLVDGNPKTVLDFGTFITAIITFLITAAVVYFIFVLPMNKMNERRLAKQGPTEEDIVLSDDTKLLMEIRDLLAHRQA